MRSFNPVEALNPVLESLGYIPLRGETVHSFGSYGYAMRLAEQLVAKFPLPERLDGLRGPQRTYEEKQQHLRRDYETLERLERGVERGQLALHDISPEDIPDYDFLFQRGKKGRFPILVKGYTPGRTLSAQGKTHLDTEGQWALLKAQVEEYHLGGISRLEIMARNVCVEGEMPRLFDFGSAIFREENMGRFRSEIVQDIDMLYMLRPA